MRIEFIIKLCVAGFLIALVAIKLTNDLSPQQPTTSAHQESPVQTQARMRAQAYINAKNYIKDYNTGLCHELVWGSEPPYNNFISDVVVDCTSEFVKTELEKGFHKYLRVKTSTFTFEVEEIPKKPE